MVIGGGSRPAVCYRARPAEPFMVPRATGPRRREPARPPGECSGRAACIGSQRKFSRTFYRLVLQACFTGCFTGLFVSQNDPRPASAGGARAGGTRRVRRDSTWRTGAHQRPGPGPGRVGDSEMGGESRGGRDETGRGREGGRGGGGGSRERMCVWGETVRRVGGREGREGKDERPRERGREGGVDRAAGAVARRARSCWARKASPDSDR